MFESIDVFIRCPITNVEKKYNQREVSDYLRRRLWPIFSPLYTSDCDAVLKERHSVIVLTHNPARVGFLGADYELKVENRYFLIN